MHYGSRNEESQVRRRKTEQLIRPLGGGLKLLQTFTQTKSREAGSRGAEDQQEMRGEGERGSLADHRLRDTRHDARVPAPHHDDDDRDPRFRWLQTTSTHRTDPLPLRQRWPQRRISRWISSVTATPIPNDSISSISNDDTRKGQETRRANRESSSPRTSSTP